MNLTVLLIVIAPVPFMAPVPFITWIVLATCWCTWVYPFIFRAPHNRKRRGGGHVGRRVWQRLGTDAQMTRNDVQFMNYRKFSADATLSFDTRLPCRKRRPGRRSRSGNTPCACVF
jgi:hypothetical protein